MSINGQCRDCAHWERDKPGHFGGQAHRCKALSCDFCCDTTWVDGKSTPNHLAGSTGGGEFESLGSFGCNYFEPVDK